MDGPWNLTNGALNIKGKVPGDLITDLYNARKVLDPIHNNNWLNSFIWNNMSWTYSLTFDSPNIMRKLPPFPVSPLPPPQKSLHSISYLFLIYSAQTKETLLVFDGVKMGAIASLNQVNLGIFTDQFLRYYFPVQKLLKKTGNVLTVTFPQAPGPDVQGR